jgi:3-hydroxyacyl-CoA dehydrogenase/enoyl-CoA hydratase/3-hydroxybutyryl-CoA epimerase
LIEEGASVPEVDGAIRRFGFPVGPLKLLDEVGIDVAGHIAHELEDFFGERGLQLPVVLDEILKSGFGGKKKGMGFYDYRHRFIDRFRFPGFEPLRPVNAKIYSFLQTTRKKHIEVPESQKRPVFLMINEAALCLQEGVISSPEDGDVGAVFGLGFPPFLGGPFRYLDSMGIGTVVFEMEKLASQLGRRFEPAPILVEMAKKEERFYKDGR